MAADVLLYNSLNEINRTLIQQDATLTTNIATQNSLCQTAINTINTAAVAIVSESGPTQAHMWCNIPEGSGWTGSVTVCDSSTGYYNLGGCCAWTVPGGVTCARFQLWGAGGNSGGGRCCSYGLIGGTGAYASVIMPVTAGQTYTLCAGCAYCCFGSATNNASGCASYVTGTGLSNFCAEGGEGNIYCQIVTRNIYATCHSGICWAPGGCICYNSWVCSASANGCHNPQACACFPAISSCKTFYGTATGGTVYGIRGSFGTFLRLGCFVTCQIHPPIYGFSGSSCCACCQIYNYQGGCCRSAAAGYMRIPGAGGWAGVACGGSYRGGDSGRGGMVRVCFK